MLAETDRASGNMEDSSSSGLDIPPLVSDNADSMSNISETPPAAPKFAEAVRKEADALHRSMKKSDAVDKINSACRSPRMSVGSIDSAGLDAASDSYLNVKPQGGFISSIAPSEFDFDTLTKDQRVSPVMTPRGTSTRTTTQPVIGCASKQMVGGPQLHNIRPHSNIDELSGVEGLMPQFARRRSAPASHQVVTGDIDYEMYDTGESDIHSINNFAAWVKAEKDESKDEPWTRLNELSTFALCGFGQFEASLGVGVYNKERKESLLRQGLAERDRLWGQGIRVPIGNTIAHGAATMMWGTMTSENIDDNALLVTDFIPWTQEIYEKFQPEGKKNEPRKSRY